MSRTERFDSTCLSCPIHQSLEFYNHRWMPSELQTKESPDSLQDCVACSEILKNCLIAKAAQEAARKGFRADNVEVTITHSDVDEMISNFFLPLDSEPTKEVQS